jgi:hypothetical protein
VNSEAVAGLPISMSELRRRSVGGDGIVLYRKLAP